MRFARLCKLSLITGALLFASAPQLLAQDYPAREIRTMCPFAPGTGADIIVRFYASKLAEIAGKPQTIEDLIKAGVVMIGSPNTVRERLAEYQDLAGFNTSLTKTQFGTLPDDMARANMQAIAQEILPAFRSRLPQGKEQQVAAE